MKGIAVLITGPLVADKTCGRRQTHVNNMTDDIPVSHRGDLCKLKQNLKSPTDYGFFKNTLFILHSYKMYTALECEPIIFNHKTQRVQKIQKSKTNPF